ncbi:MAG: CHAT domain-containing protein [Acidobacteriota bacterium]
MPNRELQVTLAVKGRVLRGVFLCVLSGVAVGALLGAERAESDVGAMHGVVVEEVDAEGAFARAGLASGDLIVGWRTDGAEGRQGRIRTWVDWHRLAADVQPLPGDLVLSVRRDGERLERRLVDRLVDGRVVGRAELGALVRPRLSTTALAALRAGLEASADRSDTAVESWRLLLDDAVARAAWVEVAWLADLAARRFGRGEAAAFLPGLARVGAMPGSGWRLRVVVWRARAVLALRNDEAQPALVDLEHALTLRREREGASTVRLGRARLHYLLGYASLGLGDPTAAAEHYGDALEAYRQLVPSSLPEAATRIGLGQTAAQSGLLRHAEEEWLAALALYDRLEPGSRDRVGILNNLGIVASFAGEWRRAEEYFTRALELEGGRGSDDLHRARALNNLGELALRRHALDRAEARFREALAIKEALAPNDPIVATSLTGLGHVALARGDLDDAAARFRRVREQMHATRPGSLLEATALNDESRLRLRLGDLAAARDGHRRALAMLEEVAPAGLDVAATRLWLGEVALAGGDLVSASAHLEEARRRLTEIVGETTVLAETLGLLAEVRRREGAGADAIELSRQAVETVEKQLARFGAAPGSRIQFRADHDALYRRWIELLVDAGRFDEAFAALERSRSRGLLELLASRHLRLRDAPPALERRRLELVAAQDRLAHRLARAAGAEDEAQLGDEGLARELAGLRRKREELADRLWRESPRVAAWRAPRPLGVVAAREALDTGTLLLAWSVGSERTLLFAVQRDQPVRVIQRPWGEEELRYRVDRFVTRLQRGARHWMGAVRAKETWRQDAQGLGEDLLGPVLDEMDSARRIVVSPDGPLHRLPFAALRLPPSHGRPGRFVIDDRPMSYIASATLLAALGRVRTAERARAETAPALDLLAFGAGTPGPLDLPQLAAAAAEAEAVAALFDHGVSHVGAAATEQRWMDEAPRARRLHFAGHAVVDPESPLDSALVFSVPTAIVSGEENGMLEAWEVFEQLELDADLVVLSACGTAVGEAVRGEGLLGLERAFLYAGARSVVASLWPVSDSRTRRVMERFYHHLRCGASGDEALRRAQLDSHAADDDSTSPAAWAAFRLTGRVAAAGEPEVQPGSPPMRQGRCDVYE